MTPEEAERDRQEAENQTNFIFDTQDVVARRSEISEQLESIAKQVRNQRRTITRLKKQDPEQVQAIKEAVEENLRLYGQLVKESNNLIQQRGGSDGLVQRVKQLRAPL